MEYVTSKDGTKIAYERSGSGPPLVLVHGSLNDRNAWGLVIPALRERFTVYAMDRRGRGESGPIAEHAMERQFEDVAAVIEAAGAPVGLAGHSYGAHCALGAAAMAPETVKHLVLYEPPTLRPARSDVAEAFAGTNTDGALVTFMQMLKLQDDEIRALKETPFWQYLCAFAPTMPSEGRALFAHGFDPGRFGHLRMPALFLVGSVTEEEFGEVLRQLRPVMSQAEWVVFEGQGHGAMLRAPKLFIDTVLEFLGR